MCCLRIQSDFKTHTAEPLYMYTVPLFPHSLIHSLEKNNTTHTQSRVECKLGEPRWWAVTIQALPFRWARTFSLIHRSRKAQLTSGFHCSAVFNNILASCLRRLSPEYSLTTVQSGILCWLLQKKPLKKLKAKQDIKYSRLAPANISMLTWSQ